MIQKHIFLQLFAEEAGVAAPDAGEQMGVTEAAAEPQESKPTFDELIKGEYKDAYNESVNKAIRSRLKGVESVRQRNEAVEPIISKLAKRYGVDASDLDAVVKAFDADASYYEQKSVESGIPAETLKQLDDQAAEITRLQSAQNEAAKQAETQQTLARWSAEAEQVKTIYPGFDLETEMTNPLFVSMLRVYSENGFPNVIRSAFEAAHHSEIQPAAMQYVANETQKATVNAIKSGSRVAENGTSKQAAASAKVDYSKLSRAQVLDIMRRVANGEQIK